MDNELEITEKSDEYFGVMNILGVKMGFKQWCTEVSLHWFGDAFMEEMSFERSFKI